MTSSGIDFNLIEYLKEIILGARDPNDKSECGPRPIFPFFCVFFLLHSTSCVAPIEIGQQEHDIVTGFDFRKYMEEGFVVTPYDITTNSQILGQINIRHEPNILPIMCDSIYLEQSAGYVKKIGLTKGGLPTCYLVQPINTSAPLEKFVMLAKQMGGGWNSKLFK